MDVFAFKKVSTEVPFLEACEVYADRLKTETEVKEKFGLADLDVFKENTTLFIEKVAEAVAFLTNRKKAKKAKSAWRKKGVSVLYEDERCIITSPDGPEYARDAGSLIDGENSCPWCVATKEPSEHWKSYEAERILFAYRKENGVPVDAYCVVLGKLGCFLLRRGKCGAQTVSAIEDLENKGDSKNDRVKRARFECMLKSIGLEEGEFAKICLDRCAGVELTDRDIFDLACRSGELDVVREMLDKGVEVSACSERSFEFVLSRDDVGMCRLLLENGYSLKEGSYSRLRLAATHGALRCCMYFVEEGDEIDEPNGRGDTTALQEALYTGHNECALYLLKHGANVNYKKGNGFLGLASPLRICAEKNSSYLMKALIRHGADVNLKDDVGWTALHSAARYGNQRSIEILIEAGADVNATVRDGKTPLDESRRENVRILLAHGARLNNPGAVFFGEEMANDLGTMCAVLEKGCPQGAERKSFIGKALWNAAYYNCFDSVKKLVEMGGEVDYIADNYTMKTPLYHVVTTYGFETELVSYLLEHGADINHIDGECKPLLERAVACGSLELLTFLLENGADPGIPTSRGTSLIEYAELLGCDEIVKVLKGWNMRAGRKVCEND